MSTEKRPIIIVKKVTKGHGGHHGGAWKVAYADFVTAMMAFFMVMWIISMDPPVKDAIEGYFQNPIGFTAGASASTNLVDLGSPASSVMPVQIVARQIEEQRYRDIGEKIQLKLEGEDGLGEIAAQVEVVMTEQGLRIELVEGPDGATFFAPGSASLRGAAERAIRIITGELRTTNAPIVVEGHTDSAPYSSQHGYTNWELSADRANAARQSMESAGLIRGRVAEIRGYADRELRIPDKPFDNSNRRISILLPFTTPPATVTTGGATSAPAVEYLDS